MQKRKRGPRPKIAHLYPIIRELLQTQKTYAEIASETGVSIATVGRIYKMAISAMGTQND